MKNFISALFFICAECLNVFSQTHAPSIVWQSPVGGSKDDTFRGMRLTPDGGCIATGFAYSSDSDLTKNNGDADLMVCKMDSSGGIQWIKTYGGSKEDWGRHVTITADGGYIVCGHEESKDFDITTNKGQKDAWLLKFDVNGNLQWKKTYGGAGVDIAYKVHQLPDLGYIFFGGTTSKNGDVSGNHGNADNWVVRLDVNGNILWQKCQGGSDHEEGSSLQLTNDGGYITSGWSDSHDGDVSGNHGGFDVWVCKLDVNGNIQWAKSYGGSGDDAARDAKQAFDGGYIITGFTNSSDGDVQSGYRGGQDLWVIKTDASGNIQWERSLGGSLEELGFAVTLAPDSTGYLVCGHAKSTDGDITNHWGDLDQWIIKLDLNGNIMWQECMGGNSDDKAREILQRGVGGDYWVAGYVNVNSGDVHGAHGGFDGWIVRLCEQHTYFADADHDGFGNAQDSIIGCTQPTNYVTDHTDCDDNNSAVNSASSETCNGLDDNCNGTTDEGLLVTYYADADGDGFGNNSSSTISCSVMNGYVTDNTDCNDSNASVNPSAIETCNNIDDNCNGTVDEGLLLSFYADADGDNFGNNLVSEIACSASIGFVTDNTDCDDLNFAIHPGAIDICNDVDDNCNGTIDENKIIATITPSGDLTICKGTNTQLSANNDAAINYQWYKNGTALAGEINSTYTTKKAGDYYVTESNSFSCSATSTTTSIATVTKPSATITPLGNLDICTTGSVDLQANSGEGYIFQWKKNSVNISGATNQIYTATEAATYKVKVTNSTGCYKTSTGTIVSKSCKMIANENAENEISLSVYPNPSSGNFILEMKLNESISGNVLSEIINPLGQIVYSETLAVQNGLLKKEIKLSEKLSEGIYLLKIISNNNLFEKQIVIQK